MKKIFILFAFIWSFSAFAQKYTAEQVEKTNDPKVVANFIKANPNHPKTAEFKRKLIAMANSDKTPKQQAAVAKPKVEPLKEEKLKSELKKETSPKTVTTKSGNTKTVGPSEQSKRTAEVLTQIFNNDPNSNQAVILIRNKSKCNLVMKISGKKFYNLTIPSNNSNYILVQKGTYTLTTNVCDAKYSSTKTVSKDIEITLTGAKK